MKKLAITVIMMVMLAMAAFSSNDSKSILIYFDVADTVNTGWTHTAAHTTTDDVYTDDNYIASGNARVISTDAVTFYANAVTTARNVTVSVTATQLVNSSDDNNDVIKMLINDVEVDGTDRVYATATDNRLSKRVISVPVTIDVDDISYAGAFEGVYQSVLTMTVSGE